MLKTSLVFLVIAILCIFAADIEVTTLNPWHELNRMLLGAATPDFDSLYEFRAAILNTITFAFCGIFIGVAFGAVLAFFFKSTPVRLFCAFIRAIHEIFWAFIAKLGTEANVRITGEGFDKRILITFRANLSRYSCSGQWAP